MSIQETSSEESTHSSSASNISSLRTQETGSDKTAQFSNTSNISLEFQDVTITNVGDNLSQASQSLTDGNLYLCNGCKKTEGMIFNFKLFC